MEKQFIVINSKYLKGLSLRNGNLLIKEKWKIINQHSCSKIFSVFIIWSGTITTNLVRELQKFWISLYCFDRNLRPNFMIGNKLDWNYILREKQYSMNEKQQLYIAQEIITNKISNQVELLRTIRNKDDWLKEAISKIDIIKAKIYTATNDDTLRWWEWNVSKLFFQNYFKENWWYKRMPRTRVDILNLLLDIGYFFLYNFIESCLNLYGFDIYKWVYHKLFYERKSLVCDVIEPFRCIIDKQIRKIYNLKQVNEKDFKFEHQEYNLKREKREDYVKLLLWEVIKNKKEIFGYVRDFYRWIMKENNIIPTFNINSK
jgi:CRISPR-associated endonuclease Cas1